MAATDLKEASVVRRFLHAAVLGREDAIALGLVRVVLVSIFTLSFTFHAGSFTEYFSDAAMLNGRFAREAFPSRLSLFFVVSDPSFLTVLFVAGIVAHLMWLFGFFTSWAAVFCLVLWISMEGRNPLLYGAPDQFTFAMTLMVALMPTGRGLSLDARWRGKGGPVPVWCRHILQLQICVLYFRAGTLKTGVTWEDGTALYYALTSPFNRHFDLGPGLASLHEWGLRPATMAAKYWQLAFPVFVAYFWVWEHAPWRGRAPDMRKLFLGFGLAFHALIQLLVWALWFSTICPLSYTAFFSPSESRRLVDWVVRKTSRRARVAPPTAVTAAQTAA